jgi:hypothetical protein
MRSPLQVICAISVIINVVFGVMLLNGTLLLTTARPCAGLLIRPSSTGKIHIHTPCGRPGLFSCSPRHRNSRSV